MRIETLQERVQQRKERPTHHTKQNNKTCENFVIRRTSRVVVFKTTTAEGVANQRGRGSTLTGIHPCHRTRIPFGHVLIKHRCFSKHCKKESATKKRKTNPPAQTTTIRFQNTKQRTERVRIVMKLELSYMYYSKTQQQKWRGHREGERGYTYSHPSLSPPPYSNWTRPD